MQPDEVEGSPSSEDTAPPRSLFADQSPLPDQEHLKRYLTLIYRELFSGLSTNRSNPMIT